MAEPAATSPTQIRCRFRCEPCVGVSPSPRCSHRFGLQFVHMPVVDVASESARGLPASSGAASSGDPTGSASNASNLEALLIGENPVTELKDLKQKATLLRKEKQELARKLRNAQRKHKRLKEKAKQLSDQDLLSVMLLRRDKKSRTEDVAALNTTQQTATTAPNPPAPENLDVPMGGTLAEVADGHRELEG